MAIERTLDVEKVTAALKRAARAAVSGSREDRNGRFASDVAKTSTSASKKPSARK